MTRSARQRRPSSSNLLQEISRFTLAPKSKLRAKEAKIWTVPVVANGRLYLRDQEQIFCFDLKAP